MTRHAVIQLGRIAVLAIATVLVANLLHRVVFAVTPPDPATFPRAGDSFASRAEGVTQHVVAVRDGWLVLRTKISPRSPGPPLHVHHSFAEDFAVETGTLHLQLPNGEIRLGPGERYRIEPGVPHRPFNPSDEEVVIGGDAPAMPRSFGACLVQTYHFLDAANGRAGLDLAIRIAALESICDSTLAEIPAAAQIGIKWLVQPFARLFGYKNYYPEFSLHPQTSRLAGG